MRSGPGARSHACRKGVSGGATPYGSPTTGPAITSRSSATSRTVRAIGPFTTIAPQPSYEAGASGTRPRVGFRPTTSQQALGMRQDPPPSLPTERGEIPAAVAAAAPPLEPPELYSRFQGFRVAPKIRFSVTGRRPNSEVFVLPITIAPASRSRETTTASKPAWYPANAREP